MNRKEKRAAIAKSKIAQRQRANRIDLSFTIPQRRQSLNSMIETVNSDRTGKKLGLRKFALKRELKKLSQLTSTDKDNWGKQ